jgi:ParB/RepB/Spo0J family partition protein
MTDMARKKKTEAEEVRAPCKFVDAEGLCTNPDDNGEGRTCYGCCGYTPRTETAAAEHGQDDVRDTYRSDGRTFIDAMMIDALKPSEYQTRKDIGDVSELAASLRAVGMLNPVTVRMLNKNAFEIIAGHRRVEAAKLAGWTTIPAFIVDCDNQTAAEMCATENMQRTDLTPLEEAEGVRILLKRHTPQDVADRLGRSRQWVARRAKLLDLIDDAVKQYGDPASPFSRMPVEALEMIAALPEDAQVQTVGAVTDRHTFSRISPTVNAVRSFIEQQIMRDLDKSDFADGGCAACTARTGAEPDLFDSAAEKLGMCLNPQCFEGKRNKHLSKAVKKARKENPNIVVFCRDYNLRNLLDARPDCMMQTCKKSDPGAVPAIKITDDGRVKKCWVVGKEQGPEADAEKPAVRQPTPEQKRRAKVAKAMRAKLQGLEDATGDDNPFNALNPVDILRIIAVTGTRYGSGYPNPKAWEKNAGSNYLDALWEDVCPELAGRVNFGAIVDCDPAYEEALEIGRRLWDMSPADVDEMAEME